MRVGAFHPKLRQEIMRLPNHETAQREKIHTKCEENKLLYLQEFTPFHQPPHGSRQSKIGSQSGQVLES
jgi:hypothetical protein